jgi:hypothetical protein
MAEKRRDRGQAMAEYMPLVAVMGAITIIVLKPMGCATGNIFTDLVRIFSGEVEEYTSCPRPAQEEEDEDESRCVDLDFDQGGSQCDQSDSCEVLDGYNSGFYVNQTADIDALVIKTGQDYRTYTPGITQDGCYSVIIDGNTASWNKVGSGPDCQDASHLQSWQTPLCVE